MTITPTQHLTRSVLRTALASRASELGIDPDTVWCPSPHAIAARRLDGGVFRIDYGIWTGDDLGTARP